MDGVWLLPIFMTALHYLITTEELSKYRSSIEFERCTNRESTFTDGPQSLLLPLLDSNCEQFTFGDVCMYVKRWRSCCWKCNWKLDLFQLVVHHPLRGNFDLMLDNYWITIIIVYNLIMHGFLLVNVLYCIRIVSCLTVYKIKWTSFHPLLQINKLSWTRFHRLLLINRHSWTRFHSIRWKVSHLDYAM